MKEFRKLVFIFLLTIFCGVTGFSQSQTTNKNQHYIFFLHNRFVEENDLNSAHPEYGKAEYNEIIESFKKDSFTVFSEKRSKNTNAAR